MSTKKCDEIKKNLKEYGLSLKEICKQDPDKLVCLCLGTNNEIPIRLQFRKIKDQIKEDKRNRCHPCWF